MSARGDGSMEIQTNCRVVAHSLSHVKIYLIVNSNGISSIASPRCMRSKRAE